MSGLHEAVILAAGIGSRLGSHTNGLPKCLLPIGAQPILLRLLDQLRGIGIKRAVIVTGHCRDALAAELTRRLPPLEIALAENPEYRTTNTAHSLLAARPAVEGDFLLCDGDVVLAPGLLESLSAAPEPCAILLDSGGPVDAEAMKATLAPGDRVLSLSKTLAPDRADGESLGVQKLGGPSVALLWETLEELRREGKTGAFYEEAFQRLIERGVSFTAVRVPPASWVEIDDAVDLQRAQARFGEPPPSPTRLPETEETSDALLHRPVAARLVAWLAATRVTPDQITWLSGVTGVAAAAVLLAGSGFPVLRGVAAVLLFLSVVLDCADGQLARARGTSTTAGATLDGVMDYAVAFSTGFAVTAVSAATSGKPGYWLLGVWVAISGVIRSWLFDGLKTRYLSLAGAGNRGREADLQRVAERRAVARSQRKWGQVVLLGTYEWYEAKQRHAIGRLLPDASGSRQRSYMKAWTWLGIGTHFALLYLAFAVSVFRVQALPGFLWFSGSLPNLYLLGLLWLRPGRAR